MRQILIECNLEHIFVNLLKSVFLIDNIKQTLLSNYVNTWQNNLESQRKLRVYKTYKTTYEEEMYVHINLSRYHRSVLARLRSCTLPLHVETGRFYNTPYDDRKCTLCNLNEVEDEVHFVFKCPIYVVHRTQFYNEITTKVPNFL